MNDAAHPALPDCRGRYPFRIATTSFILPADYLPNVRMLAPHFDEIELLFFEAGDPDFPSRSLIEALAAVGEATGVTYNVHLPVDLPICDAEAALRRRAVERLVGVIRRTQPLAATTHTLHWAYTETARDAGSRRRWHGRVAECAARLAGEALPGSRLSIETLDYPLEWVADLIEDHDLRVCLDVGHLTLCGIDLCEAFRRWERRCAIVHLHAAVDGRDHRPLDRLTPASAAAVASLLARFRGTVSLEVFSLEALQRSLDRLPALVQNRGAVVQTGAFW